MACRRQDDPGNAGNLPVHPARSAAQHHHVSEKPARVLMTVSPPGHEHYFERLAELAAQGAPDPRALADLRNRYDTDQLSTLTMRA